MRFKPPTRGVNMGFGFDKYTQIATRDPAYGNSAIQIESAQTGEDKKLK